jgi:NADPH2:quinone reductase
MRSQVIRSAIIAEPIERVWAALRDFGGHSRWHPDMSHSQVENGLDGDVVGCVRRCRIGEQTELREQLVQHSDLHHLCSYAVLDSPLPLVDHLTTLRLRPVTDSGQTFLHWSAEFRTSKSRAAELNDWLIGVFEAGLRGLRSYLADEAEPSPRAAAEEPAPVAPGELLACRRVLVESKGGPEGMALREVAIAAPEAGQVRIRQKAVAVNRLDILQRKGLMEGIEPLGTPGLEGMGEIIDVGAQVNGLYPGDRVAWVSRKPGAYTEICLRDASDCIHLPDQVSDLEASTLLKGLSAELLLGRVFRAGPGSSIMIGSAAGGLGHIICQWARSLDMVVLGAVDTKEKARFARDHGCTYPIRLVQDRPVVDEVMRITNGRGVDYWVFDSPVLDLDQALSCLARFGHLAILGGESQPSSSLETGRLKKRSLTVSCHDFLHYLRDRLYMQRSAQNYFAKLQNRIINPVVEPTPLSQASQAHQKIESRQNLGALTLIPGS